MSFMQQFYPQDDFVQRRTLNLWCGVIRQFLVEGLFQHSEDDSIANAACPPCALVAAGLACPNQLQILHPAANIKADFLAEAEIYDVAHSEDGDGGFGDVGGDDDFELLALVLVQFVGDFLVEDRRMNVNYVELPEEPLACHKTRQRVTESFDFCQTGHED